MRERVKRVGEVLKREWVGVVGVVLFGVLLFLSPVPVEGVIQQMDWRSWAGIAMVVVATTGIKESGVLTELVEWVVERSGGVRQLGVGVVAGTVGLAPIVTNDVALLISVPITLLLGRYLPPGVVERLLILEGIGANFGSGFSPIGNPQNLYLYTNSGVPFHTFALQLLPLFGLLSLLLLGATYLLLPTDRLPPHRLPHPSPDYRLGIGGVVGLAAVVAGIELETPLLLGVPALLLPLLYRKVDWGLIATFWFLIADSQLALTLPGTHHLLSTLAPLPDWLKGLLLSQLLSNFPATLLLYPSTSNPLQLAIGVNLGGNGLLWASLANLIALRAAPSRRSYLLFHLYSIPALLLSIGVALLLYPSLR